VKLNVGGTVFHTTTSTLLSMEKSGASSSTPNVFHAIFDSNGVSRRFAHDCDERGAIFLDRDPTHFRHVLNYLRDGTIQLTGMSTQHKHALLREAKFYGLHGLTATIQNDLRQQRALMRRELSHEKEYKLMLNVSEKDLPGALTRMTMSEGYDFENWMAAQKGKAAHLIFSKKLSRGELMLLDRLQTHM
jgi:hypothetical protein